MQNCLRKTKLKIYPYLLLPILYFCFCSFQTQKEKIKEVDSLLLVAQSDMHNYDMIKLLKTSKSILLKSEKIDYEKGLVYGNSYLAYCLMSAGEYQKSIHQNQKAQQYKKYLETDPVKRAENYMLLSANYAELHLYSLAIQNNHKALAIYKSIKNKTDKEIAGERNTYVNMTNLFSIMKKDDSAFHYLNKNKEITLKGPYKGKAMFYNSLGYYYVNRKNPDSAYVNYQKSLDLFRDEENHYIKTDAVRGMGNVFKLQKNYTKALEYYLKALNDYSMLNSLNNEYDLYKSIAETYNKIGNFEQGKNYLERYVAIKDSLEIINRKEADLIIQEVLNTEKAQHEILRKGELKKVFIIVAIILMLLLTLSYFFKKSNKKNKQSRQLLSEKELLISQRDKEAHELKLKVNESFEEVVELAKNNSPEFFSRFQEIYPEFRTKLLQLNPDLKTSELILCAYIHLGFNAKDIAEHTFKAEKTVRNNKYNIRKRLDVPAKADFGIWLRNHTTS